MSNKLKNIVTAEHFKIHIVINIYSYCMILILITLLFVLTCILVKSHDYIIFMCTTLYMMYISAHIKKCILYDVLNTNR